MNNKEQQIDRLLRHLHDSLSLLVFVLLAKVNDSLQNLVWLCALTKYRPVHGKSSITSVWRQYHYYGVRLDVPFKNIHRTVGMLSNLLHGSGWNCYRILLNQQHEIRNSSFLQKRRKLSCMLSLVALNCL